MITAEESKEIQKKFGKSENDSGSVEVQVAVLTKRIANLTPHFAAHKHDYAGKRGLMKLIGRRASMLKYLRGKDEDRYKKLIGELGLRK